MTKESQMVNGLYTSSASMQILQSKLDATSHNLANANTTGFKKSMLVSKTNVTIGTNDELKLHQNELQKLVEDYVSQEQGPLITTDDPFDIAIQGQGFFEIETPNGKQYSRNGSFTVNTAGELVNLNGHKVLDDSGSSIGVNGENFQVSNDGVVSVDGNRMGKLSLIQPNDLQDFKRIGASLFALKDGKDAPTEQSASRLSQGMLEGSNVNVVDSMVKMILIQKQYDSSAKAVSSIDETLNKAVNEIGRVG